MDAAERDSLEAEALALCDVANFDAATQVLLEGYGPEWLAFIHTLSPSEEDAADIFSDLSLRLWRGLARFERRSTLRTWGYQLARCAIYSLRRDHRRAWRRMVPLDENQHISRIEQRVRTSTLAYLKSTTRSRVIELRRSLPIDDQTLLILRVDREMEWNEIVTVLHDGEQLDDEKVRRESARLRKRFQLAKERLHELATREGLLDDG